ncbi:putative enterotoxin [Ophiocordyceps camponoti-rufipedis]|uniref:Putative enterotoxin n=1 Tax=Ophiocordyceps camponoti-rufipedis TaxID=2004952 RepID=A0A2C5XKC8_9HYPO|nr:putative enterotoxin [Ophiocordyceps camponoti-rufipedis]
MKISPLKALIWAALSSLTPLASYTNVPNGHNHIILTRGDGRNPETIIQDGGFLTREPKLRYDDAYSLDNHVEDWFLFVEKGTLSQYDTRYVSASTSYAAAKNFVDQMEDGYVYMIQPTPNAFDGNKSLTRQDTQGQEYSFLEGIAWSQLKAYKKVSDAN